MAADPREFDNTHTSDRAAVAETLASASRPADERLQQGDNIARYRVEAVLGAGGMGVVYKARDPDLNRDVAIKVLHPTEEGSGPRDDLQRRLIREAQAMAQLSHPNLVTVYDVGSFRGQVFLAMEFLQGGTLKDVIADRSRSWRARLGLVIEAGRGLAEAHSAGVIHRDFKPDNVLISRSGRAQVGDFGLARAGAALGRTAHTATARQGDELSSDLTHTGAILGTPAYMSPEQHRGEVADARSDQFSFAVTAFEALYGYRPFAGHDLDSLERAVVDGRMEAPPRDAEVPSQVHEVLQRALSSDPEARFPRMAALLDELEHAARERRGVSPGAMVAGVAIVLAGAAAIVFVATRDSDDGTSPSPQQSRAAAAGEVTAARRADRQAITRAIDKRQLDLDGCYRRQWRNDPTATGSMRMGFEVGISGQVLTSRVLEVVDIAEEVVVCVHDTLGRWQFDPPASGQTIELDLPFEMIPGPTAGIAMRVDGSYDVHRGVLDRIAREPDVLASGGRLVPSIKDGRAHGFKVFAIQPGSAYAAIGLRSGDTLLRANDLPLADMEQVMVAYLELRGADEIRLSIDRGGEPAELVLNILD